MIGTRILRWKSSPAPTAPLPLPFPYPLSSIRIGTDICKISRISKILRGGQGPEARAKTRAKRFVGKVLTPFEITECWRRRPWMRTVLGGDDGDADSPELKSVAGGGLRRNEEGLSKDEDQVIQKASVFLAGRWAAKEAAIKAHPWRRLRMGEVEVLGGGSLNLPEDGEGGEKWLDRDNGSEAPVVVIRGSEEEEEGGARDQMALVSISHDGEYATAVCVGFDPEGMGRMEEMERRLEALERELKEVREVSSSITVEERDGRKKEKK
ncbi:hypothetical protein QBC44DRAFT_138616 [Cladorrhinum sp. PSN332]|nr:hypothetical protein QBC44DRAFT_138616 [Cladorrhinum sp. PSN332]